MNRHQTNDFKQIIYKANLSLKVRAIANGENVIGI